MANSLADEIIAIVKSEANNNPVPERCRIVKVYDDKIHVDVQTRNGLLKYVDCIGSNPLLSDNALIVFLSETFDDYVVISDTEAFGNTSDIIESSALPHLGTDAGANQHTINLKIDEKINQGGGGSIISVGSFTINNEGQLIVELPGATDNPYFIDNTGHLIYDTSNTHNGGLIE